MTTLKVVDYVKQSFLVVSLEFILTILFKTFQITGPLNKTDSFPTSCITPGTLTSLALRGDLCISTLKRDLMEFETNYDLEKIVHKKEKASFVNVKDW